ncbi:MAG: hypothetical protein WCZ87_02790 [Thiohalobacteraceae bacterium]
MKPYVAPIGIGDLKVVKMRLIGFEPGEIAHIENVMAFETRSREHRRFRRVEEILTEEVERSEENLHEMESTERFQIEQQSQEVIRSETKFEAGAEVSAGFGPVQIGAYARFSTSQSKEQTNAYATNYAKEVMERSLNRIIERVRSERVTKTLEEFEEINKHGFENTEAEHQSGIYFWVNKYFLAKVVDYGKRLWYEFIVPQPAAFYIFAQQNHLENHVMPDEPEIPVNPDNTNQTLEPGHITRDNYRALTREHGADGIKAPPREYITLVKTIARDVDADRDFAIVDNDLEIPDGYVLYDLKPRVMNTHRQSGYYIATFAGRKWLSRDDDDGVADGGVEPVDASGVVPIAVRGHGIHAFVVVTEIVCQLTAEAFAAWQLETFRAVMNAYHKERQDYEEKLAAAQIEQGVKISGKNPQINREIMIEELQKACITLWTGYQFDGVPMTSHDPDAGIPANYPRIHIENTLELTPEITFLHQAFDWFNISFEFYPYIWAARKNWLDIFPLEDKDPLFNDFLRAGAARVLVPVHLEATETVLYYQLTGKLQLDGEIPLFETPDPGETFTANTFGGEGDPETELELYNAYIDELRAEGMTNNIDKDVEISPDDPDTWVIEEPTSLVWLQPGSELPPIEES